MRTILSPFSLLLLLALCIAAGDASTTRPAAPELIDITGTVRRPFDVACANQGGCDPVHPCPIAHFKRLRAGINRILQGL